MFLWGIQAGFQEETESLYNYNIPERNPWDNMRHFCEQNTAGGGDKLQENKKKGKNGKGIRFILYGKYRISADDKDKDNAERQDESCRPFCLYVM